MAFKCYNCNHQRVIDITWFRDTPTNLDTVAQYCRNCYYLCTYVGSLNPFKGFRQQNSISDKSMIDFSVAELEEMDLPPSIFNAIIQDKDK